jgi:hypothetical protein
MLKTIGLLFCFLSALLLLGCAKSETNNTNTSSSTANSAAPVSSPSAGTIARTAGEKIGVPECDEFIAAYDTCVSNKVPAAAREQYKASLEQWRKSWHNLAANPQTKATLAGVCKSSLEQARKSMKSYGCTF